MSSNAVLVGGVIGLDHIITTEREETDLLGGSVPFAALAASFFTDRVKALSIVGRDFPERHSSMMERHGISLEAVERADGETFRWCGRYGVNMNERETVSRDLNVLEDWHPHVPEGVSESPFLVLASATGRLHLEMLNQCRPRFTLADTMDFWIRTQRRETDEIVSRSDVFVLNEGEAYLYSGCRNLLQAGEFILGLGARFAIVKLGEYGSMLFTRERGELKMFRCAAWPLRHIVDPTGAGDAFLGALGGYLSRFEPEEIGLGELKMGMLYGSVVSSFICEDYSTRALEKAGKEGIIKRFALFHELTTW